jgi:hypothetical protein
MVHQAAKNPLAADLLGGALLALMGAMWAKRRQFFGRWIR